MKLGEQRDGSVKNWVQQHPYLALVAGYVVIFFIAGAIRLAFVPGDLADAAVHTIMNTLVYWLLALFQLRNLRKTNARLKDRGQLRAYIRYPEARPGSLSGIWNQGIVTPAAGSLQFQPAVYDNLEASGRATTLKVERVLPQRWKVTGRNRKYIGSFGMYAVTVLTDHGKVELAASPESLDRLAEALAG